MVSTRLQSTSGGEAGVASVRHNGTSTTSSTEVTPYTSSPSTSTSLHSGIYTSNRHFLDLPSECMEKIFSYLGYKHVSQLRLVNKQLDVVCSSILNSTFQKLQTQMLHRFQQIKQRMPRRESARRNHPLACESDIVETLHMRLTLLQMSFGKHIERKHVCFFAGEILDEVYRILHYIKVTPKLARPYKVTDELFDLSTMAMEYFKEHIEPTLPEIAYFGSDFLEFAGSSNKYMSMDSPPHKGDESPSTSHQSDERSISVPQQSNMVLRKRIRKIKQGMKRYNYQLSLMRKELRCCRSKVTEQQKQIVEYATRLDDYDKKTEEANRKFSTMLQELNKCKTELQYWRSHLTSTSTTAMTVPDQSDIDALTNQGMLLELDPLPSAPVASTSADYTLEHAIGSPEQRNKRKASGEKSGGSSGPSNKKQRQVFKPRNKRL